MSKNNPGVLWRDRCRPFLGLPISFTIYSFSDSRLYLQKGFFNLKEDEILLYRILDITLNRSLGQRIFGLGSITLQTGDKTHPTFIIKHIKKSKEVKQQLSLLIEDSRRNSKVMVREEFNEDGDSV